MCLQVFARRPESGFSYAKSRGTQMQLAMEMKCLEGTRMLDTVQ